MKKALVIVAHPDDEMIWMGGTILRNKNWKWTIISLCRSTDRDREPKFRRVCKHNRVKGIISNLEDEELKPLPIKEVAEKIEKLVPKQKYDYVFTHGKNGESGHIRHKETHKAVKMLVEEKKLKTKKVYYFNYIARFIPEPNLNSDLVVRLKKEELREKVRIVSEMYGYAKETPDVRYCKSIETFKSK